MEKPGAADVTSRKLIKRVAGTRHGAITRVMSPSDLGQLIKPFIFLDDFAIPVGANSVFGMHPHSGIATLTLVLSGSVWINDTVGTAAVMNAGDVEWMRASGGAWHESAPRGNERITGLQLWVTLPPHLENAAPDSRHIVANTIPRVGPARVLLGSYQGAKSPVPHDEGINYLHVELDAQSTWEYVPPAGHTVAWVYVYRGNLKTAGQAIGQQLAVFQTEEKPIRFTAEESVGFVLGSAVPHAHPLVMGPYSVHTSSEALSKGLKEINRIGATLKSR